MAIKINLAPTEHQTQAAFVEWCGWNPLRLPDLDLIYAIPNGGLRNKEVAKKLKAEGVKPGVPDMHLPVPKNFHIGLYLEFKSKTGELSKEQRTYLSRLHGLGHKVHVVKSLDQAIKIVSEYYGYPTT